MSACAASPFDHPKADVILRSSDGIDFYVFKLLLTLASPFFETMFNLPQPAVGTCDDTKDGFPVVNMQEDSKTLDILLRFFYPSTLTEDPSLESLTDILAIIGAARKYSLDSVEKQVCQALANPKVLKTDPVRCFAIARNARFKDETMTAARYSLGQPLIPAYFPELELITASDLLALLVYHTKCSNAVEPLLAKLDWVLSHYKTSDACSWLFCGESWNGKHHCKRSTEAEFVLWAMHPVAWWVTYMRETFEILRGRPTGDSVRAEAEKTIHKVKNAGCKICAAQVRLNMEEFSRVLAVKVDEAIAPVRISLH
jgi:hypothetical protein